MKKMSSTSFRALFFKHVYQFLLKVCTPQEIQGPHLIGVSGGLDSMCLLWFAHQMFQQGKIGPIRVAFVHHHTRPGQDYDAKLVEEFCAQRDIPFSILHATGLDALMGNFEARARKIRRELLAQELRRGERLWLGHHIDDSYEWSLLQRYRSGLPKSSLGIPVRNGVIVRPFLCVTKDQLRRLARSQHIIYREDPTNEDLRYNRNFIRAEIIPVLKKKFPKYLKHYVQHSNYLAMILHLGIDRVGDSRIYVYEEGAVIEGKQFSQFQITELLHTYSSSERGEIASQILKMLRAIDNGKKGPFYFSGGTCAYYSHRQLMIYKKTLVNNDDFLARTLDTISDVDLLTLPTFSLKDLERSRTNFLRTSDAMLCMPGLVVVLESKSVCKTLNSSVSDPLFPKVSEVIQKRNLHLTTCLKLLDNWKNKKMKLPEKLRIVPLWSLSNLFSSQE